MRPAIVNMYFVRGSTDPKIWRFSLSGTSPATPLPFDDARLTVAKGNTVLFRATMADADHQIVLTDYATGEITFTPTAEQTRLVPKTKTGATPKATYELELRTGAIERVYLMGTVEGIGGLNDDE